MATNRLKKVPAKPPQEPLQTAGLKAFAVLSANPS